MNKYQFALTPAQSLMPSTMVARVDQMAWSVCIHSFVKRREIVFKSRMLCLQSSHIEEYGAISVKTLGKERQKRKAAHLVMDRV